MKRKERNMKYFVKAALVTLTLLALAGCFQMDMLIKVNPDGSGTIEQTVLMKDDFIEQMKSMNQAFTPEGEEPEEFSLLNEEELKQSASTLGKGVKYVKATPIKKPGFEGYTAIYSYKDINDLNIDQNPGGEMPGNEAQEKSPEFITFKFKKGKTSELTINMPEEKAKREETS
ncbi:MAG: hypothetical protein GWN86_10540, partial [Desulfobacterales bacterium]|nr:hypothetical protein [Desulfobacterales bacterium]